jgi:hypothetical protein
MNNGGIVVFDVGVDRIIIVSVGWNWAGAVDILNVLP